MVFDLLRTKNDTMKSHLKENECLAGKIESVEKHPQTELTDCLAELRRRDKEIINLKDQHTVLRKDLQDSHDKLEAWKLREKSEIQKLQLTISKLREELEACKDDLFRVQPIIYTSDTEILNRYENISQQIWSWVDAEISIAEANTKSNTKLFSDGGNTYIASLFHAGLNIGEYLLVATIHYYLVEKLFGTAIYLFGVPSDLVDILQKTEKSMTGLKPRRENSTISNWRSETLKALSDTMEVQTLAENLAKTVTTDIFDNLTWFLPSLCGRQDSWAKLYENVVLPAKSLAIDVQVAHSKYTFTMDQIVGAYKLVRKDCLEKYKLIDAETGKTLKPSSLVTPDRNGSIAEPLLQLEPRVRRANQDTDVEKWLSRGVYLVKLLKPLRKKT